MRIAFSILTTLSLVAGSAFAQAAKKKKGSDLPFPPVLPEGKAMVTETSDAFLKPPATLKEGVAVAKAAPTVDFAYLPGQDYVASIWSTWGDGLAVNGKYYSAIGDHNAPGGNAFVYEYDPATKTFRKLLDLRDLLKLPDGHYTPGKIHSRIDIGDDGKLYCSTHRGSTKVTTDQYHYTGDWIVRIDPKTAEAEVVARGPVAKHCIPTSVLDPKRLIYYGGTAPGVSTGSEEDGVRFFAYDVKAGKVICDAPDGPARYMIFAKSTGRVYWTGKGEGQLYRFDPEKPAAPEKIEGAIGIRSSTQETPDGKVYTVSQGRKGNEPEIFSFDVKTEKIELLGPANVGTAGYITSIDADPTGRYLYYVPGAHGGAEVDGSPLIQYDVKTKSRKVVAFLHPHFKDKYGVTPRGTYATAVDPDGSKVYITWNVARKEGKAWDSVALTVVHIPESERKP